MIWLLIIPALGVSLFLNIVTLLQKLKDGKNYHNQKVLGAVILFILLFLITLFLLEGSNVQY
ncbi:MAG: hypothetical protein ABS939_05820 [Psychrobacillus sp.]